LRAFLVSSSVFARMPGTMQGQSADQNPFKTRPFLASTSCQFWRRTAESASVDHSSPDGARGTWLGTDGGSQRRGQSLETIA
jgi:hypothetical protein